MIELLANDLKIAFPLLKGFSARNMKYMRNFAKVYSNEVSSQMIELESEFKQQQTPIVQQVVAQLEVIQNQANIIVQQPAAQLNETIFLQSILSRISWSHHLILIDKEPSLGKRFWYMLNTLEHGNSRNVLAMQIESNLF